MFITVKFKFYSICFKLSNFIVIIKMKLLPKEEMMELEDIDNLGLSGSNIV